MGELKPFYGQNLGIVRCVRVPCIVFGYNLFKDPQGFY